MVLEMIGKRKYNNLDIIAYNIFDFSHEPKGAILWAVCKAGANYCSRLFKMN